MNTPLRVKRGCSPWALMGCGCGFIAMLGILLVFFIIGIQMTHERKDPTWSRTSYAECQANLRYLRLAIKNYQKDYHHLPARLDDLNDGYLDHASRLRCPLQISGLGIAYTYTPEVKKAIEPLITCTNHGFGNLVLQRDGQIRLPTVFHHK